MTIKAPDLLNKAAQHMADRAKTYDKPEGERSMDKTVQAFNTITGKDLTEAEGWLLMQLLKDVRLFQRPGYHADSAEDCIAYSALKAEAKSNEYIGQIQKAKQFVDERLSNINPPQVYDGWIDNPGKQPVDDTTLVKIKTREGTIDEGYACGFLWNKKYILNNITAYKIVEDK